MIAYGSVVISWRLHHNNRQFMIRFWILLSYYVCRKSSWTPKTQPNGSSAVVWLSSWCSTRFTGKKIDYCNASYLYLYLPKAEHRRCNYDDVKGIKYLPASAKGRVQDQEPTKRQLWFRLIECSVFSSIHQLISHMGTYAVLTGPGGTQKLRL